MNKTYLALILLLNVGAGLIGMQSNSWVFKGLSEEASQQFESDKGDGLLAGMFIDKYKELQVKKIALGNNFSAKDRNELSNTEDMLNLIGLDYYVNRTFSVREKEYVIAKRSGSKKNGSSKAINNLRDRYPSSSSSSEEEIKKWNFVNYTANNLAQLESSSEECDYTGHDRLNMIAWSSEFSTK